MARGVPVVEVTDDREVLGIRRPHREVHAAVDRMRAQLLPEAVVGAFVEQVEVLVAQQAEVVGHGQTVSSRSWFRWRRPSCARNSPGARRAAARAWLAMAPGRQ